MIFEITTLSCVDRKLYITIKQEGGIQWANADLNQDMLMVQQL